MSLISLMDDRWVSLRECSDERDERMDGRGQSYFPR
jgi:hypothetical protein